jgi:Abortive infection C-terminus
VSNIEQRQASRNRFLRRLYEVTGANLYQPASVDEIAQYIGLAPEDTDSVVSYLEQKYLLKWSAMGLVLITQYGIDEAEQMITTATAAAAVSSGPRIAPRVIGEVAAAFDQAYTHNELTNLFLRVGVEDEYLGGTKLTRVTAWLQRIDGDPTIDAHAVLGRFLEDFMDRPQPRVTSDVERLREHIREALADSGLSYHAGGKILGGSGLLTPSRSLADLIRDRDLPAISKQFDRANEKVLTDPEGAVTSACVILEEMCRTYIADEKLSLPSDQSLHPLWRVVQRHLGLAPTPELQDDLRKILGGLASIVDGTGAFRTHAGDAHGHGPEAPAVEPRHARLAVHAAHTVVTFVLETWTARTK